jgi:hypothetical protein
MDNKRMPSFVLLPALFLAGVFDIASIIPFLGNLTSVLFIFFTRLSFWLVGYHAKGTTAISAGTALVEMIPGFSILPGCIAFVTGFYVINRKNTAKKEF